MSKFLGNDLTGQGSLHLTMHLGTVFGPALKLECLWCLTSGRCLYRHRWVELWPIVSADGWFCLASFEWARRPGVSWPQWTLPGWKRLFIAGSFFDSHDFNVVPTAFGLNKKQKNPKLSTHLAIWNWVKGKRQINFVQHLTF